MVMLFDDSLFRSITLYHLYRLNVVRDGGRIMSEKECERCKHYSPIYGTTICHECEEGKDHPRWERDDTK